MFRRCFSIVVFCLLLFVAIEGYATEARLGCSIAKIQGDKVYLKPGSIQVANNGIFINVQGELKSIGHLEMDEEGVFFNATRTAGFEGRCNVCGFPLIFGFCVNPDCCP